MLFVNCVVEEKFPTKALIDFGATVNLVSQKIINELNLTCYNECNSETPDTVNRDRSFSILGKLKLRISFNIDGEHKSNDPSEFNVVGPEWDEPDLVLGSSWLRKNGATNDVRNLLLTMISQSRSRK